MFRRVLKAGGWKGSVVPPSDDGHVDLHGTENEHLTAHITDDHLNSTKEKKAAALLMANHRKMEESKSNGHHTTMMSSTPGQTKTPAWKVNVESNVGGGGDVAHDASDVCKFTDSPFYVLTLCAKGKITEFERQVSADPSKLNIVDKKGRGPLHHAAKTGQIVIMDFIVSNGADINAVDNAGNTPLHVAIESNHTASIGFLINHNADSTILNERHMAPIHLAVDLDHTEALDTLLSFEAVDSNLRGENGSTALHYAAWKDRPRSAEILLKHDARLCIPCDIGLYPMHIAAQNSSSATLEVLLEYAEKKGCATRNSLLAKMNQERNTPLHAAVSGGNMKIVKLCLGAGANIDVQQENGNSPVHLAAAQGSLEMIKLMFEMQPEKRIACLMARDLLGLTPLHAAAMFDRTLTVEYLIEQGSDIDAKTEDGQTPLLLAGSKCAWGSVSACFKAGARTDVTDSNHRNIIHLIIRGGGRPQMFEYGCCNERLKQLLNDQDRFGCTPLHYASKQGLLTTIQQLLDLGAEPNAKNNKKQSALHFAARHGRYNTCERLIQSLWGANILNEADGSGQTALHAAAEGGHAKVIQLLLRSGAGVFKDLNGNTPLHLAAIGGYTQSVSAILNVHIQLLDSFNKNKDTSLHLAAIAGHENVVTMLLNMGAKILLNNDQLHVLDISIKHGKKNVCIAVISHDRWKEAMDMRSTLYGCPMVGMIKYMPEVCLMILDRCRIPSGPDPRAKDFHYTYDFRYMQVDLAVLRKMRKGGIKVLPLFGLNIMVQFNRVECLSHPVCTAFLSMKWCAYGMWFHLTNLLIYLLFLGCLTSFIATFDFCRKDGIEADREQLDDMTRNLTDNSSLAEVQSCQTYVEMTLRQLLLVLIILGFCILNAFKEVLQMIQQRWSYLADCTNLLEWVLYITTACFVGPFVNNINSSWQWQCGAIAIFLAWFNLLLFLQRFDVFGIYVVMFLEILKTLLQVITVFSVLIIAFGFAFFILLTTGSAGGFSSPQLSLMSSSLMMLGSIDFLEVWVSPFNHEELPNPTLNFFMLLVFILLMPILLINLLIGLAVGDIEAVQKDARLKRIAMQVQLHTDLELKLPHRLLRLVDRPCIKIFPNCSNSSILHKLGYFLMKKEKGEMLDEAQLSAGDQSSENQYYLYRELDKQKNRMKQISSDLARHYDLLRLIVQKMEIHTEADDFDEVSGCNPAGQGAQGQSQETGASQIGWSSPALRQVMMKQALVLSKWKKSDVE